MENKETKKKTCEYCGLIISCSGHLKRHISNIHLKEKPFQCEFCDFTTNQKCNLKKHATSHLKITNIFKISSSRPRF